MSHRIAFFAITYLLSFTAAAQEPRDRYASLTATFSEPVMVGIKLAFAKNHQQGKVNTLQYQCIQRLQSSALREPVYEVLARSLSEQELLDAQRFYESETGRKYAKYGVLQIYPSVGEKMPEQEPVFTSQDERVLKEFADLPAGRKLIREQILEKAGLREALAPTVNRFVQQCMYAK